MKGRPLLFSPSQQTWRESLFFMVSLSLKGERGLVCVCDVMTHSRAPTEREKQDGGLLVFWVGRVRYPFQSSNGKSETVFNWIFISQRHTGVQQLVATFGWHKCLHFVVLCIRLTNRVTWSCVCVCITVLDSSKHTGAIKAGRDSF